jgi:hypothetical protein
MSKIILCMILIIELFIGFSTSNEKKYSFCPSVIYSMGPFGGYVGSSFNDAVSTNYKLVHPYIINVRAGTSISYIQITYKDIWGNLIEGNPHGGQEGELLSWIVPENEKISQAVIYARDKVYSLQFITNKNNYSPRWGGYDGSFFNIPIVGSLMTIYGRNQTDLIQIGFTACNVDV